MPLKILLKEKGIEEINILFIFWKEIQLAVPIVKSIILSEISKISKQKAKTTAKNIISGCEKRLIWMR